MAKKKKKTEKEKLEEKITKKYLKKVEKIFLEKLEAYPLKDHMDWAKECSRVNFDDFFKEFVDKLVIEDIPDMPEKNKVLLASTIKGIKKAKMISEVFELTQYYEEKKEEDEGYYFYQNIYEDLIFDYKNEYHLIITSDVEEELMEEMLEELKKEKIVRRLKIEEKDIEYWLQDKIFDYTHDFIQEKEDDLESNWSSILDDYDAKIRKTLTFQKMCKKMETFLEELENHLLQYQSHKEEILKHAKESAISKTKMMNIAMMSLIDSVNSKKCFIEQKKSFEFEESIFLSNNINHLSVEELTNKYDLEPEDLKMLYSVQKVKEGFDENQTNDATLFVFPKEELSFEDNQNLTSLVVNGLVKEDPLNFQNEFKKLIKLSYAEIKEKNKDKDLQEHFDQSIQNLKVLCDERKKQKQIWLQQIVGESVFERYKMNSPEKIVIHTGETNTGKTYHALQELKKAKKGAYLAPLRLLALEVYEEMQNSGIKCSYITGEEQETSINDTHVSCTIEKANYNEKYDCVVIDEAQMIGDKQRGSSWVKAILGIQTKELHIIVAPEGLKIVQKILDDKELEVREYKREKPLIVEKKDRKFSTAKKGDALVVFSRRKVLETAYELERMGKRAAIIYGSMPPSVRRKQVEAFKNDEYDVVVTTDAIGMGLNLPIENVFFLENRKYDGENVRELTVNELKQIAGRAGRKGFYERGTVSFFDAAKWMAQKVSLPNREIQKIFISPNLDMVKELKEKVGIEKPMEVMEMFFENWKNYKPQEEFVSLQKTREIEHKLNKLKCNTENLSLEEIWHYIYMPFDFEEDLEYLWLKNIRSLQQHGEVEPLECEKYKNLEHLEFVYKELDLHMQFLDENDVTYQKCKEEKEDISEKIFEIIKKKYGELKRRCTRCKKRMKDEHEGDICDTCIRKAEKKQKLKERKLKKLMKNQEIKK